MNKFRDSKFGKLASFVVMMNFLGLLEAKPVMASIEPITSTEMSPLDPTSIARAKFASPANRYDSTVSDSVIDSILKDEDHKISSEFQVYPEFQTPTKFWLKIYAQYSTKDVVIYDSKDMNIIYEVLNLRPIQQKSRNAIVFEILSERKIKKTISAYKKAFLDLSKDSAPKQPSREQSLILKAVKTSKTPILWKEMALSIKSMKGQRDPIVQGLLNGEEYFPKMEKLFIQAGVPVELTRLCLVESSFNIKAGSKVGASGLWQIMPRVGKQYLKMDESKKIDERLSALKSSIAAAKLLKFNYKYLGSWLLAVVSYNHGFKGLPRLKPHTYSFSKIAHLFHMSGNKKEVLGWASKNYYSEYLAILHASMYAKQIYGDLPESPSHRSFEFERLTTAKTGLNFIAEKNISEKDFLAYNTDIQDLNKPLIAGLWLTFPGKKQNFQEMVDYSLG
ncbi:MAG: lytic transglycosylase domain-containing protein, partial [Bdellovibrionia bacterium]